MTIFVVLAEALAGAGVIVAITALIRLLRVVHRPSPPNAALTRELRSLELDYADLEDRYRNCEQDDGAGAEAERARLQEQMAALKRSRADVRRKLDAAKADPSTVLEDWKTAHPLEYRRAMATATCALLLFLLAVAVLESAGLFRLL